MSKELGILDHLTVKIEKRIAKKSKIIKSGAIRVSLFFFFLHVKIFYS